MLETISYHLALISPLIGVCGLCGHGCNMDPRARISAAGLPPA